MKLTRRAFFKKSLKYSPLLALFIPGFYLLKSGEAYTKAKIKLVDLQSLVNDTKYFFVLNRAGKYKALSKKCTHLGCTLSYDALNQAYSCPCHKSHFSIDGEVLKGPAKLALRQASTRVDKEYLYISL